MSDKQILLLYIVGVALTTFVRICWVIWQNRTGWDKNAKLKVGDLGISFLAGVFWFLTIPFLILYGCAHGLVTFFEAEFWNKKLF